MSNLNEKVVVITGASSGIGKATAVEFAKEGAKVVLAGRDGDALRETESECKSLGADAMAVIADVTKADQVERLASKAEEAFGHIDIWVNNAGVALVAKFDEAPMEDYRQVIETDFFGYVYGARSALKRFKSQGFGTIINIDSVEGLAAKPYTSAYSAAKHAVRALASSLRMELALDNFKDIYVSTVIPAPVETPLLAHAANYTGQGVTAQHSNTSPGQVAHAITKLARHPQRELIIGGPAKGHSGKMFSTAMYEQGAARGFVRRLFSGDQAEVHKGNLYEPTEPHSQTADWQHKEHNRSNVRKAMPWVALGGIVFGAAGLTALFVGSHRKIAKNAG